MHHTELKETINNHKDKMVSSVRQPIRHIVIEKYNSIYTPIPKVGCSSIKSLLAEQSGMSLGPYSDPHLFPFKKLTVENSQWPSEYNHFYRFAFVRNPYARILSCYRDKIKNLTNEELTKFSIRPGVADCLARFSEFYEDMSFEDFTKAVFNIDDSRADAHFRSQYTFISPMHGGNLPHFLGKLEDFQNDWEVVCEKIGLEKRQLPDIQSTERPGYRDYYSQRMQKMVADRFYLDLKILDYSF